jgi:hypothetical protein
MMIQIGHRDKRSRAAFQYRSPQREHSEAESSLPCFALALPLSLQI